MKRMSEMSLRLMVAWEQFKADQRGAQTLEWLALALLILGLLFVAQGFNDGSVGTALKDKFKELIKKLG